MNCLFAQKKKNKCKDKRSIEELCCSFTEKDVTVPSLLASLLTAVTASLSKAAEGRAGLLWFTVSTAHQCRKFRAALCPSQETERENQPLACLFFLKSVPDFSHGVLLTL